jgi:hypothetical protein
MECPSVRGVAVSCPRSPPHRTRAIPVIVSLQSFVHSTMRLASSGIRKQSLCRHARAVEREYLSVDERHRRAGIQDQMPYRVQGGGPARGRRLKGGWAIRRGFPSTRWRPAVGGDTVDHPLAMDVEAVRRTGYAAVDALSARLANPDADPVLRRASPAEMRALLGGRRRNGARAWTWCLAGSWPTCCRMRPGPTIPGTSRSSPTSLPGPRRWRN